MKKLLVRCRFACDRRFRSAPARAEDYPQRTIRIVVSFGPGGGADIIGRILADSLQSKLGQPVIVENKPGAGGILGNDVVAKATPDGYTLGIMTAGQIIAAVTKKNMPYDTNAAFAPVGQVATASLMIVTRPDFPANNVKELVAYAKAIPARSCSPARALPPPSISPANCSSRSRKSTCCMSRTRLAGSHQRRARQARRHLVRHGVGR